VSNSPRVYGSSPILHESQWGYLHPRIDLHDCHGIVVEDGGHIFRGEFVGGVRNQQTGLSNRTVADNNAPTAVSLASFGESTGGSTHLIVATTMFSAAQEFLLLVFLLSLSGWQTLVVVSQVVDILVGLNDGLERLAKSVFESLLSLVPPGSKSSGEGVLGGL
jgi:hypothetical protein